MKRILPSIGRLVTRSFLMIAEPRVRRLFQFVVYICLGIGGQAIISQPPGKFEGVIGAGLVLAFGLFVMVGAILGAVAVLPGWWWVERVGIVSLGVGLFIFMVLVTALGASVASFVFGAALFIMFLIRYLEIRPFALAPKLG